MLRENARPGRTRAVVLAGLFLAIAVMWQSLRFFVPFLNGPWNIFLIGSLVKGTLVLAMVVIDRPLAAAIALFLPVIAFLQGQLTLLPLVPVVALGSAVYALLARCWWGSKKIWLVPFLSAAIFGGGVQLLLKLIAVPPLAEWALNFMFSWPQVITGAAGILLVKLLLPRLKWLGRS